MPFILNKIVGFTYWLGFGYGLEVHSKENEQ